MWEEDASLKMDLPEADHFFLPLALATARLIKKAQDDLAMENGDNDAGARDPQYDEEEMKPSWPARLPRTKRTRRRTTRDAPAARTTERPLRDDTIAVLSEDSDVVAGVQAVAHLVTRANLIMIQGRSEKGRKKVYDVHESADKHGAVRTMRNLMLHILSGTDEVEMVYGLGKKSWFTALDNVKPFAEALDDLGSLDFTENDRGSDAFKNLAGKLLLGYLFLKKGTSKQAPPTITELRERQYNVLRKKKASLDSLSFSDEHWEFHVLRARLQDRHGDCRGRGPEAEWEGLGGRGRKAQGCVV